MNGSFVHFILNIIHIHHRFLFPWSWMLVAHCILAQPQHALVVILFSFRVWVNWECWFYRKTYLKTYLFLVNALQVNESDEIYPVRNRLVLLKCFKHIKTSMKPDSHFPFHSIPFFCFYWNIIYRLLLVAMSKTKSML